MAYIYALTVSGETLTYNNVRYVGKTIKPLKYRLYQHIYNSDSSNYYCARWIKSLIRDGLKPEIHMLVIVPSCAADINEKFWISYYRGCGSRLTNLTDGGEGVIGLAHSEETKKKISEKMNGHAVSVGTKTKISLAGRGNKNCLGYKHTEETRKKMSAWRIGGKLSYSTKDKISLALIGRKISDETRHKLSLASMGNKSALKRKGIDS